MKRAFFFLCALALAGTVHLDAAEPSDAKASYIKKSENEVQEWTAKLKSLEERSEKSGAKTREQVDQTLQTVEKQLTVASKKLDDLRGSSEGSWDHFRKELDEAMRNLKHDYRKAAEKEKSKS